MMRKNLMQQMHNPTFSFLLFPEDLVLLMCFPLAGYLAILPDEVWVQEYYQLWCWQGGTLLTIWCVASQFWRTSLFIAVLARMLYTMIALYWTTP